MTTLLLLAAALVSATPEDRLAERMPDLFARAAEHYKALDAAATPKMKDAKGNLQFPHGWKKWKTGKDELDFRDIYWWTSGHFPGSLWYLYEATGDAQLKDRALAWTEILAPIANYSGNHDIGFMMYCSYGNARRLLKTDKYDKLLMTTARTLAKRYNNKLKLIRSWGDENETKDFLVIPDNLMNLELLEWAAGQDDGHKLGDISRNHADTTMRHHFRPDGGCWHVLDYDQATGKVQRYLPGQGLSVTTAWSRGQSWAIYGYTMMYRSTGFIRYLDFAKKLADYALNHPNMPKDGIPYWDYGAPGEERDSSAAAIMASALIELSQYVGPAERVKYRAFAVRQLTTLSSPEYFSQGAEIGHFILKHGVGHKPAKSEIDTPLDYGDYYYLEALLRLKALRAREKGFAKLAAMLPARPTLPAGELVLREGKAAQRSLAEAALTNAIPDTTDELYLEYWKNGNRSHYQDVYFKRLRDVCALAEAETRDGKGRYLKRLGEYLTAFCEMKSWVLPAHDWPDGSKGVIRGTWISTDLVSTQVGADLACILQMLGDRLDPALVRRVKDNIERRVFGPVRRETPARLYTTTGIPGVRTKVHWWINGENNWNAVCWDNVVCAACGVLDDPLERAYFIAAADKASERYLKLGFAEDGYCTEGMGYWNYGFGHYLQTGHLVSRLTQGRYNYFRRAKTRLAAAYARAYTLREGASPAFADGNGAVAPKFLALVDKYWPDLPKTLPPYSVFTKGQVWLLRDAKALSVAFKGGNNAEHHNHNDIGSYYVMDGAEFVAGDPGLEIYTRRTFSPRRYESKVINSYGHPVPVIAGRLQVTGSEGYAEVIDSVLGGDVNSVTIDCTCAYAVRALKSFTRTFTYDRKAKTFTVRDSALFSEPTTFEDCYITLGKPANVVVKALKGKATAVPEEIIENPGRPDVHRFAWKFTEPVREAEIEFIFKSEGK